MKITITGSQKSLLLSAINRGNFDLDKGVSFLNRLLALSMADMLLPITPVVLSMSDDIRAEVLAITYVASQLGLPILTSQHYALAIAIGARL
jgi:hypothetical protein